MAAMDGFSQLLWNGGLIVDLITCTGAELIDIRYKGAQFIFRQCNKDGYVRKEGIFDRRIVDVFEIDYYTLYYSGFMCIPRTAAQVFQTGRMTALAGASHCHSIGTK